MSFVTLDPSLCPVCGQSNQCAMAADLPAQQCWCMGAEIPAERLADLSPELRNQSCLCPRCAVAAASPPANHA
ncbi:MAG: cysteine-rich CWC family protein [Comamonas sp.]